ncbi:hypothetical protein LRS06_23390 [Hymenobacter sp. J193]|uniref:TraG/VirB4 family ATPase n=1 Tax=Hymenobacter sp. J193 TaxID=2898429 RepID=UPI002151C8F3|nr:hypothetical protein [Hymenobacter sp. J193]MCR5890677.1 hypothetical protein [Hymenobacter sp. J193]
MSSAPWGSGKSYTFGNLIVQRFEKGARQIIMDVGGTYRNVLQSLNGEDFDHTYFEYDPQRPIEFNPFIVPRDASGSGSTTTRKPTFTWLCSPRSGRAARIPASISRNGPF